MGKPDRLREEGYTEEEIHAVLAEDGFIPEKPQNPETARRTIPEETDLEPYSPPPTGDDGSDAGVEGSRPWGEDDDEDDDEDDEDE